MAKWFMCGIPVCIQAHIQIFTIDVKNVPMHVHYCTCKEGQNKCLHSQV